MPKKKDEQTQTPMPQEVDATIENAEAVIQDAGETVTETVEPVVEVVEDQKPNTNPAQNGIDALNEKIDKLIGLIENPKPPTPPIIPEPVVPTLETHIEEIKTDATKTETPTATKRRGLRLRKRSGS